jgi:hypothetical protein
MQTKKVSQNDSRAIKVIFTLILESTPISLFIPKTTFRSGLNLYFLYRLKKSLHF